MSSNVFSESGTAQSSDINQNIKLRIAELQKQINELRRQIQTIPQGPPGPPGPTQELVVSRVEGDLVTLVNDGEAKKSSASCPDKTVLTGGGFSSGINPSLYVLRSAPISSTTWKVIASLPFPDPGPTTVKAYAMCASLTSVE